MIAVENIDEIKNIVTNELSGLKNISKEILDAKYSLY